MAMKIEDIIFWLAILAAIGIMIWKLFGSPTDLATLVSIVSLLFVSELTLWKAIFSVEKKAGIGFMKVKGDLNILKNDMSYMKNEINYKFNELNKRLDNIGSLIRKRR